MREIEATGPSVEQAIEAGLAELGRQKGEVEVEVLSEGEGSEGQARVRLVVVDEVPTETDHSEPGQARGADEVLEFAREDTLDFLEGLLESAGLEGEVEAEVAGEGIQARMLGEDLGPLIGRSGRTLEAVQELLRAAVQHQAGGRVRVNLDIEGYRERRREAVERLAEQMAERAREDGEVRMEPMPAFERKVVHDTVATLEGVVSLSEGEEPRRYVVIRAEPDGD